MAMNPRRRFGAGDDGDGPLGSWNAERRNSRMSDIRGDRTNIAILFVLYVLQGIPLGLSSAIPIYLQNRGVSYRQQAEFSFVYWPFSLKLLWAPIVDSVFSPRFGRRKSWLIPTQYMIGVFMVFLSLNVDHWLGVTDLSEPNISVLTLFFFLLNFLAATQDIAVDGWALTMLKRCNVGHASTCNSVGQTTGYFLGYVVFIGLDSAEFCNTFLRKIPESHGLVSLSGFLFFWGIIFVIVTTLVAILKGETNSQSDPDQADLQLGFKEAYILLWDILKLPSIRTTMLILLTSKIGYSACDSVTSLKLVDAGIPKEKLALLAVPMVPLQIVLPLIISKYTVGPRPMDIYITAVPYRLCFNVMASFLVWITPYAIQNGNVPLWYYVFLLVNYSFHQVALYSMFVAVMAFFARISDPAVGGTYMTLLNTVSNLGGNWPATLALWLVDSVTFKSCSASNLSHNTCNDLHKIQECAEHGGKCETWLDGYYIENMICFFIGWIWLYWAKRKIDDLQRRRHSAWQVARHRLASAMEVMDRKKEILPPTLIKKALQQADG